MKSIILVAVLLTSGCASTDPNYLGTAIKSYNLVNNINRMDSEDLRAELELMATKSMRGY